MGQNLSKEEAIFNAALEIAAADQRVAYLEAACAEEPELRRRVEALLRRYAEAAGPLDRPAPGLAATTAEPMAEVPGTVIGPYKLLEQIGEGGFGVVFMAEQQEPIRRKVALKVLKPGMDSKQVIARFEAERQALALMDHPNIAKVLDAGQTSSGRPYFIMDLVKGMPFTDYADQNNLPVRQRLELFVAICQAVQHAHQKGIIHRDIKPSNVLVTLHDGTPVVKVIDFGIAKALGQQLTDKTLHTGFAQLVGTPLYMSPEQAALSGLDVDTRSDIYSLGVLLYELLTGTTPFDKERLKEVGFDELRRIIREEEPAKPSTRISTLGQAASTISTQRRSDPRQLSRLFRGELDWIVMKALEKDRGRRYETASAFAADVERYLNDEPVQACPPSAAYRFRKFARRNKAAMTAIGLVSAALLLGAIISGYFALQANERAAEAVAEKTRAQKNLRGSLEVLDLLTELDEKQLALEPRQEPIRAELMKKTLAFYEQFLQENAGEPSMRRETGMAYHRAGKLHYFLGQYAKAEPYFQKGIDLLAQLAEEFPGEPAYRQELGRTYLSRTRLLEDLGRLPEAEQTIRRAVDLFEPLATAHANDPEYRHDLAQTYNALGVLQKDRGLYDAAEKAYQEALKLGEQLRAEAKYHKSRAICLGNLAALLQHTRRIKDAEQAFREAIASAEKVVQESKQERPFQATVALLHSSLGMLLQETSRPLEAEKEVGLALEISNKLLADFPGVPRYRFKVAQQQHRLAILWWETGKLPKAAQLSAQTCELLRKLTDEYPQVLDYLALLATDLNNLSLFLKEQENHAKACEILKEAIACQEKVLAINPKNPESRALLGGQYMNLAHFLRDLKAPAADLENAYRRAVDHAKKVAGEYPNVPHYQSTVGGASNNWARWLRDQGQPEKARALLQEAITWQEKAVEANPKNPTYREFLGNHYGELAVILKQLKSPEEEQALRKAIENRRALLAVTRMPGYESALGGNLNDCATALMARGEWEEARRLLEEAITSQRNALASDKQNRTYRDFLRKHYRNLGKTLTRLGQPDQAEEAYRLAIAFAEGLVKDATRPKEMRDSRGNLADGYSALGHLLMQSKRPKEQEKVIRQGLTLWQELVDEFPEDLSIREQLATVQYNLAVLLLMQGKLDKARPLLEKAIPHARAAYAPSRKDRGRLLMHYRTLIDVLLKLGDHAAVAKQAAEMVPVSGEDWKPCYQAAGYLQRCLFLAAKDQKLTPDQRMELTQTYDRQLLALLAESAKRDVDHPEVQRLLALFLTTSPDPKYRDTARALDLAEKALKQSSTKGPCWAALGVAQYRLGKWQEAITVIEKARQLKEGKETLFFLAMAYWKQGEKKLAQERYDEALEWMKQNAPAPWVHSSRDEAAQLMGLKKE
jgi:serine/threonine protein kinase/uncharacterized protein HemY